MIRNKSNSTIVLEWMGRKKELPAGWSFSQAEGLDPESESYLVLKYPDVLESDIKENLILKMVKEQVKKEVKKKTEKKAEKKTKKVIKRKSKK